MDVTFFAYCMLLLTVNYIILEAIEKRYGYSFAIKKQPMISHILATIFTLTVLIVTFTQSLL